MRWWDARGAAPAEFVLVGALVATLTLAVLQVGLALYVRNVLQDAAVEGAYAAAFDEVSLAAGKARAEAVIRRSVGSAYAEDVAVRADTASGVVVIRVTVRAPLPVVGLFGVPGALEVSANAPTGARASAVAR